MYKHTRSGALYLFNLMYMHARAHVYTYTHARTHSLSHMRAHTHTLSLSVVGGGGGGGGDSQHLSIYGIILFCCVFDCSGLLKSAYRETVWKGVSCLFSFFFFWLWFILGDHVQLAWHWNTVTTWLTLFLVNWALLVIPTWSGHIIYIHTMGK